MDKFEKWDVKKHCKSDCCFLDFDWCKYKNKKCSYDICPFRVKSSHRYVDTYGRTIEKIS